MGTKRGPDMDAFMDASTESNLITDYVLKVCCINSLSCFGVIVYGYNVHLGILQQNK